MGVKSYVAGLKSDATRGAVDTAMSVLGGVSTFAKYDEALDNAKDKADITRETTGIEGLNEEFLNNLKFDRDYDKYQDKINSHFDELASRIDENELLSEKAKHAIKNEYLPIYKNQVASKAGVIKINGKMAEVEVEVEGFGNALASDESLGLDEALEGYRAHLADLGIFNEATIGKMVEDYAYATSPIKAMQIVQKEYMDNQTADDFDFTASMDRTASELGLDALQKKEMKKQLAAWKESFDKQRDELFSMQLEEINAGIAQAYDEGEIFDVTVLDEAVGAMPARHRLNIYKAKNSAYTNNDKLIEQAVREIADEYAEPSVEVWTLVGTVHDPGKRDDLGASLLAGFGESLVAKGQSLAEVRKAMQEYDAPITAKARNKALADLTKAYLDREGDVTKVAKDMLSNVSDRTDTIARIPQNEMIEAVETAKPEAPRIDVAKLEARGEEYIAEHVDEVARAIAPKISIGLGLPGIKVDADALQGERGTVQESPPEVVKEVARLIVEEQVDMIANPPAAEEPSEEVTVDDVSNAIATEAGDGTQEEANLTWEEPWWYPQYSAKKKERMEEIEEERTAYQARIAAQAESVRKAAGVEEAPAEEKGYTRPALERGMTQDELVANMLQIIRDGEGRYITQDELALIRNDDIRAQMIEMASTKDAFLVDSPLALSFIDSLRRDVNVSQESLRRAVEGFVNNGLVKAETAESGGLTKKYNFANNPNETRLIEYLGKITSEVFPTKKGEVYNSSRDRLHTVLNEAANDAIAMNPELLGKDFPKLQDQLQRFATEELAKKALSELESVTKHLAEDDVIARIRNLEDSSVSTFMQDVKDGQYDVLLDYDLLQQDEVRILRNSKRSVVLDVLAKRMTPYQDYAQLEKEGTRFEQLRVMANTSFLLAGGALEKSLQGSFGIKPKDMKIMGKSWAFADPVADGLYFIATDTDVTRRGTLGWGMATADSDGVHNLAMFKDYVDPQLVYEIEDLGFKINDPLLKKQHEEFLNPTPKRGGLYKDVPQDASWRDRYGPQPGASGGMWADAPEGASRPDSYKKDTYQEKIDLYEQKKQELKQLTEDIMQYRYSLMGLPATALRKRL